MALYMDIHNLPGVTSGAVAKAHVKDLESQGKHGVKYLRYWVDEHEGKVFCLVEAPNAEVRPRRPPRSARPGRRPDIRGPGRRVGSDT